MSGEKVLLFHFTEGPQLKAVRTILFLLQLPERLVRKEEYGRPIRELLEKEEENQTAGANHMMRELDGQMMVFAGIQGDKLDSLLSLLRSNPACGNIPYKAVLTERNQNWNAYALFEELKREHEAMGQK